MNSISIRKYGALFSIVSPTLLFKAAKRVYFYLRIFHCAALGPCWDVEYVLSKHTTMDTIQTETDLVHFASTLHPQTHWKHPHRFMLLSNDPHAHLDLWHLSSLPTMHYCMGNRDDGWGWDVAACHLSLSDVVEHKFLLAGQDSWLLKRHPQSLRPC